MAAVILGRAADLDVRVVRLFFAGQEPPGYWWACFVGMRGFLLLSNAFLLSGEKRTHMAVRKSTYSDMPLTDRQLVRLSSEGS